MKKDGLLPDDWEVTQCLFGEHLLNWSMNKDKVVAVVESEKTALIGAAYHPQFLWLATGGKSQMPVEKMKVLTGRTVILFPDVDAYEVWKKQAETLTFCKVNVSDALEKHASPEQRAAKIDIADVFIENLKRGHIPPKPEAEYQWLFGKSKSDLEIMTEKLPCIQQMIDELGLVEDG
jgi:hypothetical protein